MTWDTLRLEIKNTAKEAASTTLTLLKIMIPVSIIVKLLKMAGVITVIGDYLAPIMETVGLPGDYGLVWATAMITNIYGGLVVFFSLAGENPLTVAQVTVLGVMILLAHTLPVEVEIARQAGVRIWFTLFLRVMGAFLLGWILHGLFTLFQVYQYQNVLFWNIAPTDESLLAWVGSEAQRYALIFLIVLGLLALMRILKISGVIERMNKGLAPFLKHLGMSQETVPLTMIGMTLGLAYGGGLIIQEARSKRLHKHDVFLSLSFMGLSHSLIEDTLLMVAIGASLSGVLVGRVIFSVFIMYLLIKCIHRLPPHIFKQYFVR